MTSQCGSHPGRRGYREHAGEGERPRGDLAEPAETISRRRDVRSLHPFRGRVVILIGRVILHILLAFILCIVHRDCFVSTLHLPLKVPVHARDPLPRRRHRAVDVVKCGRQLTPQDTLPLFPLLRPDQTQAHHRIRVPLLYILEVRRRGGVGGVVPADDDRRPGVQRGHLLGPEQWHAPAQLRRRRHPRLVPIRVYS